MVDCVEDWQDVFLGVLGRRLVFAGDEYYLLAERPFPDAEAYEGFAMHEDGVGMARTFELELFGAKADATGPAGGLLRLGRHRRAPPTPTTSPTGGPGPPPGSCSRCGPSRHAPVGILTGDVRRPGARPAASSGSAGPTCGSSRSTTSSSAAPPRSPACWWARTSPARWPTEPTGHRYLLPDVCLSNGRFLDGTGPEDLPRPVEVVADRRPRPAGRSRRRRPAAGAVIDDRCPPSPSSAAPTWASPPS